MNSVENLPWTGFNLEDLWLIFVSIIFLFLYLLKSGIKSVSSFDWTLGNTKTGLKIINYLILIAAHIRATTNYERNSTCTQIIANGNSLQTRRRNVRFRSIECTKLRHYFVFFTLASAAASQSDRAPSMCAICFHCITSASRRAWNFPRTPRACCGCDNELLTRRNRCQQSNGNVNWIGSTNGMLTWFMRANQMTRLPKPITRPTTIAALFLYCFLAFSNSFFNGKNGCGRALFNSLAWVSERDGEDDPGLKGV